MFVRAAHMLSLCGGWLHVMCAPPIRPFLFASLYDTEKGASVRRRLGVGVIAYNEVERCWIFSAEYNSTYPTIYAYNFETIFTFVVLPRIHLLTLNELVTSEGE